MSKETSGKTKTGSSSTEILLDDKSDKTNDFYKDLWIEITNKARDKIEVRKVKEYTGDKRKVILNEKLTFEPEDGSTYDIPNTLRINVLKYKEMTVKANSSKNKLPLSDADKKTDKLYNNYWVQFTSGDNNNYVRRVKNYLSNALELDSELPSNPKEGDKFRLLPFFVNNYIILGLDFTNLLGMDFSSLIDTVGGKFNFQIGTVVCCVCCILCVCVMLLFLGKGKKGGGGGGGRSGIIIPGLGRMGSQQPLVIQMPMQTQPYPFPSIQFPRDT